MKRLCIVVTFTVLLVGLILIGLSDTSPATAITNVYYIETTIGPPEASNSSASGTIMITMYAMADE